MLDVNVIRSNPDMIRTMLRNRNKDEEILDRFLAADSEWRSLTDENNRLRKVRNEVSLQISKMPKGEEKDARIAEMREVSEKVKANDERMAELEEILFFANRAAALSVTRRGAWQSIPYRREVEEAKANSHPNHSL